MAQRISRVRRGRNRRTPSKFRMYGATERMVKTGSSVATAKGNTLIIAHHASPPQFIMKMLGRALIRFALESNAKHAIIIDWTESPALGSAAYKHLFTYRTSPIAATASTTATAFSPALTYAGMADELSNALMSVYTTSQDDVILERLYLRHDSDNDDTVINLRPMIVHAYCGSVFTMTNNTDATSTGGSDMHDIRANPLLGRAWEFRSNFAQATGLESGRITNVRDGVVSAEHTGHIHPPNFYSNSRKSGQVVFRPGELKVSKLNFKVHTTLNRLMKRMKLYLNNNANLTGSTSRPVGLGPMRLFEFEHMIDNSDGTHTVDNPHVNYEVAISAGLYVHSKMPREASRIDSTA